MTIAEIIGSTGGIIVILFTLIQISPIKLDPWSYIAKKIGKAINSETNENIEKIDKNLEEFKNRYDEREAVQSRIRILRFNDELLRGMEHSKDMFDQTLLDIDEYEKYCEKNHEFRNNITLLAIENIKDQYKQCMMKNSFL